MTSTYSAVDLIRAKREGQALNSDQIAWLIRAYTDDIVADATRDGGYPPLMINPIDFTDLYRRQTAPQQPTTA